MQSKLSVLMPSIKFVKGAGGEAEISLGAAAPPPPLEPSLVNDNHST